MNTATKKLVFSVTSFTLLTLPLLALAVAPGDYFKGLIDRFLTIVVLPLFSGLVVIMFIYAGFLFLTAQGDPTKISTAKKMVIWGIIGVIIALLSYSIVTFITNFLNPSYGINGAGGGGPFRIN
jgi:hypothetical protein